MNSTESPFFAIPQEAWLCSNALAFAIYDAFPVSPGHVLVIIDPRPQASITLVTGQPHSPLWKNIGQRVSSAVEIDLLASFIQPSELDLIQLLLMNPDYDPMRVEPKEGPEMMVIGESVTAI
jgi:hypothetical protein